MCDECGCRHVDRGEVLPGLRLLELVGTYAGWALARADGYFDVRWTGDIPPIDPLDGMTDEQVEAAHESALVASMHVADAALSWGRTLVYPSGLRGAAELYQAMVAAGYKPDEDGHAEGWIHARIARLLHGAEVR